MGYKAYEIIACKSSKVGARDTTPRLTILSLSPAQSQALAFTSGSFKMEGKSYKTEASVHKDALIWTATRSWDSEFSICIQQQQTSLQR